MRFLVVCQLVLLGLLAYEAFLTEDMKDKFAKPPPSVNIVLCRFLCAIFLHISLADELNQALVLMKYALNHPWKFDNWYNGYSVGLHQLFVLVFVEFVNLAVLLTNDTIMDIIMNFLALVIISDFDDYFFITVKDERMSLLISDGEIDFLDKKLTLEDLTIIETTTSQQARFEVEGNKLAKPNEV